MGPIAPLSVSGVNPHYFSWGGRTCALVGACEHYGAVLNTSFDIGRYLDTIAQDGLNLIRVFSGAYRESPGMFGIPCNTLAPGEPQYLAPWVRLADGRWDLAHFSQAYDARLESLMSGARERGIVVEFSLFTPFYDEKLWLISPFHPDNNVNGAGLDRAGKPVDSLRAFSLDVPSLLEPQEALVRHVVRALNHHPNLYYEVMNEPYCACGDLREREAWHAHMAALIAQTEAALPQQHLVSWNTHNSAALVRSRPPHISMLNFHYAHPVAALGNAHLDCPVGDNETGFLGTDPLAYRQEAWLFLLSGGAAVTHLDYSFTTAHPDGTFPLPSDTPGGGGPVIRSQLAILRRILDGCDLTCARPTPELLGKPNVPMDLPVAALTLSDQRALFYIAKPTRAKLAVTLPTPRPYRATWLDPATGRTLHTEVAAPGRIGAWYVVAPTFDEDIACLLECWPES